MVEPYGSPEDEATIYLLGVVVAALCFDMKVSMFAAVTSVLVCDFVFIPPRMAFAWTDARKTLTFLAMMVVAAVISGLSERLRYQEKVARRTAWATRALYDLNVELSGGRDPRQLAAVTARHLERLFDSQALILLRSPEGSFERPPAGLDGDEIALAERAWVGGDFAVRSRASGFSIWLPVLGIRESLGVIGLKVGALFAEDSQQGLLLSACARELATAIERMQLAGVAHRAQLDAETERMRSSFLSAVSHDLKTPLSSIVAAGTTLIEHQGALEASAVNRLLSTIVREGERLGRLLQNVLSLSRLESPTIALRKTPEGVEDIVAGAVGRFSDSLAPRRLNVVLPPDLPWALAEPVLIEQVLLNLLENALRYTPPDSTIEITAQVGDGIIKIGVTDTGPGISEGEREKVFEKFYRGSRASKSDGGVGLGLTICRAIVEAHGGKIAIRERPGGGALVEFTLPTAPPPSTRTESHMDALR